MKCQHYWRDGILRVERGEADPHRDTCADCRRAHEEREALIRALPQAAAMSTADPAWNARVRSPIAGDEASRARRSTWLGAGVVAACAAMLLLPVLYCGDAPISIVAGERPRIEIVTGPLAMRSTSARVGDRVRVSVPVGHEVRVYRAERLVLRCPARAAAPGCTPDLLGLVAEAELAMAGEYQVVLIFAATADPAGSLDRDLAAVIDAGGDYRLTDLSVR
jgi:hypothetical protein